MNSPYEYPSRHWELDGDGQPTQRIIEQRRSAQFISPIPKPRKQKGKNQQQQFVLDEGHGLSTESQQYDTTSIINVVREHVDRWRCLPDPKDWRVTPETWWQRYALVIVDELGYLPLARDQAQLLFQFFAERYERGSVLVTSNLEFSRWGEVLGDTIMTTALLDRLTHHARILSLTGESYRFREAKARKTQTTTS